jgi:hypothetical protein
MGLDTLSWQPHECYDRLRNCSPAADKQDSTQCCTQPSCIKVVKLPVCVCEATASDRLYDVTSGSTPHATVTRKQQQQLQHAHTRPYRAGAQLLLLLLLLQSLHVHGSSAVSVHTAPHTQVCKERGHHLLLLVGAEQMSMHTRFAHPQQTERKSHHRPLSAACTMNQ